MGLQLGGQKANGEVFFFYFIVNIRINYNSKMESGENLQLEKETKEEQVF